MKNRHQLQLKPIEFVVSSSDKNITITLLETVLDIEPKTKAKLWAHHYKTNQTEAYRRYKTLLEMPCHVDTSRSANYASKDIVVGGASLSIKERDSLAMQMSNLGVKKFRFVLKKGKRHQRTFQYFKYLTYHWILWLSKSWMPPKRIAIIFKMTWKHLISWQSLPLCPETIYYRGFLPKHASIM